MFSGKRQESLISQCPQIEEVFPAHLGGCRPKGQAQNAPLDALCLWEGSQVFLPLFVTSLSLLSDHTLESKHLEKILMVLFGQRG